MTKRGRIAAAVRDARAGVIPQREKSPPGARTAPKRRKMVEVEYRWAIAWRAADRGWKKYWRKYATVEIARQMIERAKRKTGVMEFRLKDRACRIPR